MDRSATLDMIRRSRSELEATIDGLSHEQIEARPQGGWSIKDHLAHIAAWEQSIVALLQGRPRHQALGVDQATYESHDVDEINEQIFMKHASSSVAEVLALFHSSHQQIMAALEPLTDDDLRKTYSHYLPEEPGEDSGAPILDWIAGDTYRHYAEHLVTIRELANG